MQFLFVLLSSCKTHLNMLGASQDIRLTLTVHIIPENLSRCLATATIRTLTKIISNEWIKAWMAKGCLQVKEDQIIGMPPSILTRTCLIVGRALCAKPYRTNGGPHLLKAIATCNTDLEMDSRKARQCPNPCADWEADVTGCPGRNSMLLVVLCSSLDTL